APTLDDYTDISQPTIEAASPEYTPGIYTYELSVEYPSCTLTDEVTVTVADCCNGETGDLVFTPFDGNYPAGVNYLTASYLFQFFEEDGNLDDHISDEDMSCFGHADEVKTIVNSP